MYSLFLTSYENFSYTTKGYVPYMSSFLKYRVLRLRQVKQGTYLTHVYIYTKKTKRTRQGRKKVRVGELSRNPM